MKKVAKIGVMSVAKIQAVITGALYLAMAAVVNIVGAYKPEIAASFGIPPGVMGVVGFAVSGVVIGFVAGALVAWLYNVLSPKIGQIEVELK